MFMLVYREEGERGEKGGEGGGAEDP